ncbi:MAG: hypothetical protein IT448_07870 [Phycisphaerales bacterium]|nr:hypothetical protein [Phycisphaerales bacterium]
MIVGSARTIVAALFFFGFMVSQALAWGTGHEIQTKIILDRLPEEIASHLTPKLSRQAMSWSHYPDSFDPLNADLMGEEAIKVLQDNGIKNRYGLHFDKGRAIAFTLLVQALRAKEYERAIFWICCLSHSTGDMGGANHATLMHIAIYDWPKMTVLSDGQPVKFRSLDLSVLSKWPQAVQMLNQTVDDQRIADDGSSVDEVLTRIMMYGPEGGRFIASKGVGLLRSSIEPAGQPSFDVSFSQRMSEFGAWGAVRVLRDVNAALRLAQSPEAVQYADRINSEYQTRRQALTRSAKLSEDGVFNEVFQEQKETDGPKIGVLMEPLWRMNDAILGFDSRYISAAIGRTLNRENRPWIGVNVVEAAQHGLATPDQMPILIVVAERVASLDGLRSDVLNGQFKTYLDAGGKILWIGGDQLPVALRQRFSAAQTKLPEPANIHWPPPIQASMPDKPLDVAMVLADGTSWPLGRNPQTPAGWQRPYNPWWFENASGQELNDQLSDQSILLKLTDSNKQQWAIGMIAGRMAYLPLYAVHPFLWGTDIVVTDPTHPALDAAGRTVLLHALDGLAQ